ncbi:hypothetical protein [Natronococcus occultus]|uniref:Uncharacterized protein n=1 Tax=Natronococcus occultus SP4 TaxID=694430 RepID=L0K0M1_9EURY|nr:hypothetical protein [Natronococcus occultus]AGB38822.1 hypothetical protein Natoc_3079 [Natronococcus occultus SP4]
MRWVLAWLSSRLDGSQTDGTADQELPRQTELVEGIIREQLEFTRIDEQPYTYPTEAVAEIKQLKRERRHDEVEELLLWCIDFVEAEADDKGYDEPPHVYYRHLAIVYRKECRYEDEVELLERYLRICETLGGEPSTVMRDRLERARELADN